MASVFWHLSGVLDYLFRYYISRKSCRRFSLCSNINFQKSLASILPVLFEKSEFVLSIPKYLLVSRCGGSL
jgi:hypothetical protein